MPKFKKIEIRVAPKGVSYKDSYVFDLDVSIDADGWFYATLPENVVADFESSGIKMDFNRKTKKLGYVVAENFSKLQSLVVAMTNEHVSMELVEEKIIIRYGIDTNCFYTVIDGEIHPNTVNGGVWKSGTIKRSAINNNNPYSINVSATAYKLLLYRSKSGKEHREYRYFTENNMEGMPYLKTMQQFTNQGVGGGFMSAKMTVHEVDYTEPIAKLFCDMLKSICKINEQIIQFIEPDKLKEIADSNIKMISQ